MRWFYLERGIIDSEKARYTMQKRQTPLVSHRHINQIYRSQRPFAVQHDHQGATSPASLQSKQPPRPFSSRAPSPSTRIVIEARQLLARILDVLLRLHAHVEDRTVLARADDLAVHAALTALALRPQPAEADFQVRHLMQRLLVQLADPRAAVLAHRARHLFLADERLLAAHTRLGPLGELHQPPERGGRNGDGAGVLAREQLTGFPFAQDGVEDAAEGFGELVLEVIFRVDGDVVFEHEDGVFGALVVLCAAGAFDDNVGDAVAESGRGAGITLFHPLCELDMGLLGGVVVFGLGEGFRDDKFGHVDFVLQKVRDCFFDVAEKLLVRY